MRHEIEFDKKESFMTIRTTGELSADGHELLLSDLLNHPSWKAGMNVLMDYRAASLEGVTLYDVQRVSALVKMLKTSLGSGGRCAILLSNNSEFTKVAMWKVMTAPDVDFKIDFFDSIEAAEKWLHESV